MFMSVEQERRMKVFQTHWVDKHYPSLNFNLTDTMYAIKQNM